MSTFFFQQIVRGRPPCLPRSKPARTQRGRVLLRAGIAVRITLLDSRTRVPQVAILFLALLVPALVQAVPANDDFASALTLVGPSGSAPASNYGATREIGEPAHAGNPGGHSVWFRWAAPASVRVSFWWEGSDFNSLLAVYQGRSMADLREVASNNDARAPAIRLSALAIEARAGDTYFIALDGFDGAEMSSSMPGVLRWAPTPSNDRFGDAQVLENLRGSRPADNTGALMETNEPDHGTQANAASVWYRWVAPQSGRFTFAAASAIAGIPRYVAIYTGSSLTNLVRLASADSPLGPNAPPRGTVTIQCTAGQEYRIAIGGGLLGTGGLAVIGTGPFDLSWAPVPSNDDFVRAEGIAGATGTASGNNTGASSEQGEPPDLNVLDVTHTVWYRWSAPTDGCFVFDTADHDLVTPMDSSLGVFRGQALANLSQEALDDDSGPGQSSRAAFSAHSGETYYLQFSSRFDEGRFDLGEFLLNWTVAGSGPANDNFADAVQLPESPQGQVQGTNVGATPECGEPDRISFSQSGGSSVWYRWTAPGDMLVAFTTDGSQLDTMLWVYTGDQLDDLHELASNDDLPIPGGCVAGCDSFLRFQAKAGTEYQIAVDGWDAGEGDFVLNWAPVPVNDRFESATVLNASSGTIEGNTLGALSEPLEPSHAGIEEGGRSVWFSWSAKSSGLATLTADGSAFPAVLSVYRGRTLGALEHVVSDDRLPGCTTPPDCDPAHVAFQAVEGTEYRITVTGRYLSSTSPELDNVGSFRLTWSFPEATCSGDCDGNGSVTVAELIYAVNIALGTAEISGCGASDTTNDGQVTVDELIAAVNAALTGCS